MKHLRPQTHFWLGAVAVLVLGSLIAANTANQLADHDAKHHASHLSQAFRDAAEKVLPSVVYIQTTRSLSGGMQELPFEGNPKGLPQDPFGGRNPFEGTPFEDFFKDPEFRKRFQPNSYQPGAVARGLGSGVIVDPSGIIVTNNHVVNGGEKVMVRLHDGREFEAVEVHTDPKTDLAIVRIEASDLQAASWADSDQMEIGDWVLALGQPYGLESTVTAGIISAKHRGIGIAARENFLQTDAAINPGNSGGPLVNLQGKIIGINTAISSRSGGNQGIGFAVPSNLAKWVTGQLAQEGIVKRAYLGVSIQPIDQKLASQFEVKPREGVLVTMTFPNTPAKKAGLEVGDVIVKFDGQKVNSVQELQVMVERTRIGETAKIEIVRSGQPMTLTFTAEPQPKDFGVAVSDKFQQDGKQLKGFGMEVETLKSDVAKQLGMEDVEGVVVTAVKPNSPAAEAGLKPGAVITQVNRKPVKSVEEFDAAVGEKKDEILLLVRSGQGSRFVVLRK